MPEKRYEPHRGDEVERWLKGWRDSFREDVPEELPFWTVLDDALDDYRLHADTGTPLDAEVTDA
jgi:hypothetical protein